MVDGGFETESGMVIEGSEKITKQISGKRVASCWWIDGSELEGRDSDRPRALSLSFHTLK